MWVPILQHQTLSGPYLIINKMPATLRCPRLTASFLQCLYRPCTAANFQVLDCLAPRLNTCSRPKQITISSAPPSTEPKPESLNNGPSAKRRKPLSSEQRAFLDSAVNPQVDYLGQIMSNKFQAPRQPSRRTRCNTHIHRSNTPHRAPRAPPQKVDATHVRPRGRALRHL